MIEIGEALDPGIDQRLGIGATGQERVFLDLVAPERGRPAGTALIDQDDVAVARDARKGRLDADEESR